MNRSETGQESPPMDQRAESGAPVPEAAERPPAQEKLAPLPQEIVDRYAAIGVDVSDLTEAEADYLKRAEERHFPTAEEKTAYLRQQTESAREFKEASEAFAAGETEGEATLEKMTADIRPATFDTERELARLRELAREVVAQTKDLPPDERRAERQKRVGAVREEVRCFSREYREQREAVAETLNAAIEWIRDEVVTESGLTAKEIRGVLNNMTDSESRSARERAEQEYERLKAKGRDVKREDSNEVWWWKIKTLGDRLQNVAKGSRVGREDLLSFFERKLADAKLMPDEKDRLRQTVESMIDRQHALEELRGLTDEPQELFRTCFGREPKGQVTAVIGPFTAEFVCAEQEDFAWIYSGDYRQDEPQPDTSQTATDRVAGVSVGYSRAESKTLEQDPDLAGNPEAIKRRRQLLRRLTGSLVGIRQSLAPTDGERHQIRVHEEQHAIHRVFGEVELGRGRQTIATQVGSLEESGKNLGRATQKVAEAAGPTEIARRRLQETLTGKALDPDLEAQFAGLFAASVKEKEVAELERRGLDKQRQEQLVRLKETVLEQTARSFETRAKDEILAYYLDGRLTKAVLYDTDSEPEKPGPAYLKATKDEDGSYDYFGEEHAVGDAVDAVLPEQTAAEMAGGQEVRTALLEHLNEELGKRREIYLQRLNDAYVAIKRLENAGYDRNRIIRLLQLEPLRNWRKVSYALTREWPEGAAEPAADEAKPAPGVEKPAEKAA